jgi:hypothetical protein
MRVSTPIKNSLALNATSVIGSFLFLGGAHRYWLRRAAVVHHSLAIPRGKSAGGEIIGEIAGERCAVNAVVGGSVDSLARLALKVRGPRSSIAGPGGIGLRG